MANTFFQFKEFRIEQEQGAMKVTTDACLLGAWTAACIQPAQSSAEHPIQVLDIGTGTGLLALMLAQAVNASIDAIEIEPRAAEQAAFNVNASKWKNRIRVLNTDIRTYEPGGLYDVIISNPPFYENDLRSGQNEKNMAFHDSSLSLSNLFSAFEHHLSTRGNVYLLLPYKRKGEAELLLGSHGLSISQLVIVRPTKDHEPFRLLIAAGKGQQHGIFPIENHSIRDSQNNYTSWFSHLLRPYYLYL